MQERDESRQAWVDERMALAMYRLEEIAVEADPADPVMRYFRENAAWILSILKRNKDPDRAENERLYAFMQPEIYRTAADNPEAAVRQFGKKHGRLLGWLQTEIRMLPALAALKAADEIAPVAELFIEIYNYYEAGTPDPGDIRRTAYWYVSDYCDMLLERYVRDCLEPQDDVVRDLILHAPADDPDHLCRYGRAVTGRERWTFMQMAQMDGAALSRMALSAVEDLAAAHPGNDAGNVRVIADIGSERLMRAVSERLSERGYTAVFCLEPVHMVCRGRRRAGIGSMPANQQYAADHAEDLGLFLDSALCDRVVKAAESARHHCGKAKTFAGVIDLTGTERSVVRPAVKPEAVHYNDRQRRMAEKMMTAVDDAIFSEG